MREVCAVGEGFGAAAGDAQTFESQTQSVQMNIESLTSFYTLISHIYYGICFFCIGLEK